MLHWLYCFVWEKKKIQAALSEQGNLQPWLNTADRGMAEEEKKELWSCGQSSSLRQQRFSPNFPFINFSLVTYSAAEWWVCNILFPRQVKLSSTFEQGPCCHPGSHLKICLPLSESLVLEGFWLVLLCLFADAIFNEIWLWDPQWHWGRRHTWHRLCLTKGDIIPQNDFSPNVMQLWSG